MRLELARPREPLSRDEDLSLELRAEDDVSRCDEDAPWGDRSDDPERESYPWPRASLGDSEGADRVDTGERVDGALAVGGESYLLGGEDAVGGE